MRTDDTALPETLTLKLQAERNHRLCTLFLILMTLAGRAASAAPVNPAVAQGNQVLYIYNKTKLEKSMAASPADPARIAMLQTQRRNDDGVIAYLKTLGFVVQGTDEYSSVDITKGKDLILISESVDALDVGGKYRNVPVPLTTFENDLLPDLGMTGLKTDVDTGTLEKERLVWIVNAPHPLAGGLAAGTQNVLDDEHVRLNWGKPEPGAITIAMARGESSKAAIFAYERGATMHWEFLAPARRVSFFLYSDTFEHLRPEGLALFKATLLWAVTAPE